MPIVSIGSVGKYGVISDAAPHELPPNAWSYAKNMHFPELYAEKISGHEDAFGTLGVAPMFTASVRNASAQFWIYAGAGKVFAYDGSTHTDISRTVGAYGATYDANWQGGILNGVPILNNGVDLPQMWNPVALATPLAALSAWPATATCKTMRAFKNFLVALDITKSGVRDPRLVKWSHGAAAGAVPTSWDETDATKDAGEYSIADTDGFVVDSVPLGAVNIIYKDDSVWRMQYVGGVSIFSFSQIFNTVGVFNRNCAAEFQTGKHAVFAKDDLVVHDGQTVTPIIRGKNRTWLYNNVDPTYYKRSFVAVDTANREVWFCFPELGEALPTLALVWNWYSDSWGVRELSGVSHIGVGPVKPASTTDTWAEAGAWDADVAFWGDSTYNPSVNRLLMCNPGSTLLQGVLGNSQFSGVNFSAVLERKGLGIPFDVNSTPDISSMKFCRNVWPRLTGTVGGVVRVEVGTMMTPQDEPTWVNSQDFTIGTTQHIDCTASGRLFAIRFSSDTNVNWKLQGYDLDVEKLGGF